MAINLQSERYPDLIFDARDLNLLELPRVDCHLHTSWTDGHASVKEVYNAAVERQLETVLYSEHSRKSSVDWFYKFAKEVHALPVSPCKAYVGTEVKVISHDGEIYAEPEISDCCDFIMASVHNFIASDGNIIPVSETMPNQSVDLEYALTWAVLSNPQVEILGHIFGVSYKRFGQIPPDEKIKELIARAAEFGVAIDINSYYHPNTLQMFRWCQEYGAKTRFGSDAHSLDEVGTIMRKLQKEVTNA